MYKLWHFFPASPYIPHKATPHLVDVCFRFEQTAVFPLLFSLLRFIIKIDLKLSSVLPYKLYFVFVHNVYIACKNVELVLVLSSVFCYLLRFLENPTEGPSVG